MPHAVPILPAKSILETRAFYERLGFRPIFCDDAHFGYLIMELGNLELQFFRHTTLDPSTSDHGAYIRCEDVDEFCKPIAALGLPATGIPRYEAPTNRPWGMREGYLVDLNGTLLRMGQPI